MLIDLVGVSTRNKGAELMLISMIDEMKSYNPEVTFAAQLRPPAYEMHRRYSIHLKVWFDGEIQFGRLGKLIPKIIRKHFDLVVEEDVDIILDGSGFAYGDQWSNDKIRHRIANHIVRWKKQGKKVILLPQAFGPFENVEIRDSMKKVLKYADLVFARDKESFDYLSELTTNHSNIFLAPDFTNLLEGNVPVDHSRENCEVAFIPNSKMLQMTKDDEAAEYIETMVSGIKECILANKKPFLLLHENKNDESIAREILTLLDNPIPIVMPEDPLEIKGIIGTCEIVVSSRFHGLVSALSQGVPVVATGWSHKYKELLTDYSCENYLISVNKKEMNSALTSLFDENIYNKIKQDIVKASCVQKKASKKMWKRVEGCL